MKELDMIKAFAKLEGFCISINEGVIYTRTAGSNSFFGKRYNPIADLSLNCVARDKYEISVIYKKHGNCIVKTESCDSVIGCGVHVDFVPKAVIEVILKSKGLWG